MKSVHPKAALVLTILLSGCVSYNKQPVAPAALAAARAATRLDTAAVTKRLATLAPDAEWNGHDWDRLALFAAALDTSPAIAAARAALTTAIASARAARVRAGPTLTLTSEYAGAAPEASPWLFGALLDFPFETAGRRGARLTSADLGVAAARQTYRETVWQVRQALRQAIAGRLIADRHIRLYEAIIAVRQRQFAATERRVAAGAASRAELERVRADTADAVRRRADAEIMAATADAALAAAIGVPVLAVAGLPVRWDSFDAPPPAYMVADMAARATAIAARADVLKAVIAYDVSEADLRGEVAKQFPAISIGPGYTWERGLVKLPINLGLVLPPLDANRSAIAAAEARRAEAGSQLEVAVARAQSEIDAALVAVAQARMLLAKVRTGELPAAQRLAAQADHELAAGSIDRSEWAAAQAGAGLARVSELDALALVHAADAGLEDALRRVIAGPETQIIPAGEPR